MFLQTQHQDKENFIGNKERVEDFFNLDNISRQFPGKSDYVTIKNQVGEKIQYQKRLMIMSVDEAYTKFLESHTDCKISRTKFFELRPKYIALMKDTPHNMSVCIYCSNFEFLFVALKLWLKSDTNLREFLIMFQCGDTFDCASNSCDNCKNFNATLDDLMKLESQDKAVNWKKWIKIESHVQKANLQGKKVSDAIQEFNETFAAYKLHIFVLKTQTASISELKSISNETSGLIIMDFSQNYATTSQDEVQSAYFSHKQISLFTAVSYIGSDIRSFAILSDETVNGKEQIYFYQKLMIETLIIEYSTLANIVFITDGCAAQFKNRYTLGNLLFMEHDFGISAQWIFTPSCHGKSAADGIGGSLKRQVFNRVMTNQFNVNCALDFVNCAKTFSSNVKILHVAKSDYDPYLQMLKERWNKMKLLPGTKSYHYFEPQQPNTIIAAVTARGDGEKSFKMF